ncbi:hypothetical protein [Loigolactobacillus jiayinensis]|uniref:Uncharacterized protein n=1 Tax=Loigolactobacillus jiayinensis TaxID=2486016 RepID=A0ABW1RFL7_9LACO|nr:hypothetical protein [Loigolactobacillus jiayinensis]
MTKVDQQVLTEHLTAFLKSKILTRLTTNQQKYAEEIISDFNQIMAEDEGSDDLHWTAAKVKRVMLGRFATEENRQHHYIIAVVPVLSCYQKFLGTKNYTKIEQTLKTNRTKMQRHHLLHMTTDEFGAAVAQFDQVQKFNQELGEFERKRKVWFDDLEQQLKSTKLSVDLQEAAIDIIDQVTVEMINEGRTFPQEWDTEIFKLVLEMSFGLNPDFPEAILALIQPALLRYFNYLLVIGELDHKQHTRLLQTLIEVNPALLAMGADSWLRQRFGEKFGQMMAAGIDLDDTAAEKQWLDDNSADLFTDEAPILKPGAEPDRVIFTNYLQQFHQAKKYRELLPADKALVDNVTEQLYFDIWQETGNGILSWNGANLRYILRDYWPHHLAEKSVYFQHAVTILRAFFDLLPNGTELQQVLSTNQEILLRDAANRATWGPAKTIGMRIDAAGIDLTDTAAVQQVIDDYNAEITTKKRPNVIPFSKKKRNKKKKRKCK